MFFWQTMFKMPGMSPPALLASDPIKSVHLPSLPHQWVHLACSMWYLALDVTTDTFFPQQHAALFFSVLPRPFMVISVLCSFLLGEGFWFLGSYSFCFSNTVIEFLQKISFFSSIWGWGGQGWECRWSFSPGLVRHLEGRQERAPVTQLAKMWGSS